MTPYTSVQINNNAFTVCNAARLPEWKPCQVFQPVKIQKNMTNYKLFLIIEQKSIQYMNWMGKWVYLGSAWLTSTDEFCKRMLIK